MSAGGDAVSVPAQSDHDVLGTPAAGPAAVRGGAFRVVGYLLGALAGAASAALMFRHLGVNETGRYGIAVALVAIVAALSDLGLNAVGVREISVSPLDQRWRLAQELLGLRILMTTCGVLLMTAVAAVAYDATIAGGVALAGVGLLVQATQDNFAMPLVVELRLGWISAFELLRQVLNTVVILILVVLGAHLLPFLGASIPVGVVVLVATVRVVRGRRALRPVFDGQRWRHWMKMVLPYAAAVAAATLYARVSILLVSALSTSTQLGYFTASFRIVEVLMAVPGLLAGAAFPIFARAAREDHARLGYAIGRVFEVALVVGAWLGVSVAVAAPLAISLIGGPSFKPADQILALQGLTLGAMFVSAVWANGLVGLGLFRQILVVNVLGLAVNAALVSVLVVADGARGAAIGTGVAEVFAASAAGFCVIRGRPALRPSLRVVPPVILATVLGLAPLALEDVPVILRLAISVALFAVTILLTRALPPEVLALLPERLRGRFGLP